MITKKQSQTNVITLPNSSRYLRFIFAIVVLLSGISFANNGHAQTNGRAFSTRFSANTNGKIVLIGNTILSCAAGTKSIDGTTTCENGQNGVGPRLDNNDFNMVYVDIDGNTTTFNSSSASLTIHTGTEVLFAGLYWGAFSNPITSTTVLSPTRNRVLFSTPASSGYISITAHQLDDVLVVEQGNAYQGFADVTELVQVGRSGVYTVANLTALTGEIRHGGWGMVVVYKDSSEPLRNLVVYDGFRYDETLTKIVVPIDGFLTPAVGVSDTQIGLIGYDGDLSNKLDQLYLNTTPITNTANPFSNTLNSSISYLGTHTSTRLPNYTNTMSIDVDLFDASGILPPRSSAATLNFETNGEKFLPGVLTFATKIYRPVLDMKTSIVDLNGGSVNWGDELEYTVVMTSTGSEDALNVVVNNIVPTYTTYMPGTMVVVSNPGGVGQGNQSDQLNDDLAEVVGSNLFFRLGRGATNSTSGSFLVGDSGMIRFRVKVNPFLLNGTKTLFSSTAVFGGPTAPAGSIQDSASAKVVIIPKGTLYLPLVRK
jgi:uncharacterized repeat protein (TIGR01451 family)